VSGRPFVQRAAPAPSPLRQGGRELLELLGLCGLVIAQPVLAVFGAAPDYFVFEGAGRADIILFALVVGLAPAVLLWGLVQLVGWGDEQRRRTAHRVVIGLLVGLLVLQVATGRDTALPLGLTLALGLGAAAAWAHHRWPGVRLWAAWMAPVPLVVLGLFLFSSPVSGLVRDDGVDPAELGAFGSGDPPPVVMIVFDEWPLASVIRGDGTIDADLYPNVAALAGDATWYPDTTTVANLTNFAVPSLLTGNRPVEGETADASTHPENLFTLLGDTYALDVTERITRLCPSSLCTDAGGVDGPEDELSVVDLLTEATDVFVDRLTPGERPEPVTDVFVEPDAAVDQARGDDQGQVLEDLLDPRPATLDRFLRGIERDELPTLHFLHVLEPHTPYLHLPDGHRYGADPSLSQISSREDGEPGGDRRSEAEPPALWDRQRLQLEVAHVDRLIGDVLDRLRNQGLYDEALVVMTSDHGIAFQPGGPVRGLGIEPIEASAQPELLWVPLFVKAPGQVAGTVSAEPAETIDVLPTIAERLGIDLPWTVEGRPLDGTVPPGRDRRFVHVQGSSFATFHLDPPVALDADLGDVLARGVDSVLPGRGPDRWWTVGPESGRVGQAALGPALTVTVDGASAFLDVDLDEPVVPAVVSGRIEDGTERVVVAVNGTIAAVVDTFTDDGGPGRFAAMVSPEWLMNGDNEVTIHRA
jgi:hypothetical protein